MPSEREAAGRRTPSRSADTAPSTRIASYVSTSASTPPSTPLIEAFDEERTANEPVRRADEPHDRDLAAARQHRHADRRADDDHRHRGEGEPERNAGDAGDVAQPIELRDPLFAEANVVDERQRLAAGRRRAAPSPDRESPA